MGRAEAIQHCLELDRIEASLRQQENRIRSMRSAIAQRHGLKPGEYGFVEGTKTVLPLTDSQRQNINDWLRFGQDSAGTAHLGYFSRGGFGYECLKEMLAEDMTGKCPNCKHKAHAGGPCLNMASDDDCLCTIR
jgi:hypothetical protein